MMKSISLWQPHATLISLGVKPFETRSWSTPYRGEVAIHAAKKLDGSTLDEIVWVNGHLRNYGVLPLTDDIPFGAVVCVARLVHCHFGMPRPEGLAGCLGIFGRRRYAWELADVRPLAEPVVCGGAQRLWDLPGFVEARVRWELAQEAARA